VRIIHRPNVDMSYGAYVEAVRSTPHATHFIVMEDDYCFSQDHFDEYLLDHCPRGMRAGAVWDWHEVQHRQPHAAVFLGIVTSDAIRTAIERGWHGRPLTNHEASSYGGAYYSQVAMSQAILQAGFELIDWLKDHATAFWNSSKKQVEWYSRPDFCSHSFVIPIQATVSDVPIRFLDHNQNAVKPEGLRAIEMGCIGWDGDLLLRPPR
jgi:hypothetical protein